jgi:hypothetical protein
MDLQPIIKKTDEFLKHLGLDEEPFGVYYADTKPEKAVLGGFDPSARKFMKPDELTFTVPLSLYRKMLDALPESMFNGGKDWMNVRKKVERSAKAWGERE